MRRKADHPLLKVTLNVYRDDWEKLAQFHPRLGPSRVARELIHSHVTRIENQAAPRTVPLAEEEMDKLI